jgi:hypothetical protein
MSVPQEDRLAAIREWAANAAKRARERQRQLADHVHIADQAQRNAQAAAERLAARKASDVA